MRLLRAGSSLLALTLGVLPMIILARLTGATPAAQAGGPVILTVDSTADSDHSGACNPGVCTLRDALNAANTHAPFADTIRFAPGLSGTITLTSSLPAIIDDVTLDGSGHALTISGATVYQVLSVTVGTHVSLNGLTLADGLGADCGGLTCGGGIQNSGQLTVTNSLFVNNNAYYGAGIWNLGALTVTNSTFAGGFAYDGGGIWSGGTLLVSNTTFSGNGAADAGGGLLTQGGTLSAAGSTFAGNNAYLGGALANLGGTQAVANSTFYSNTAHTAGGGLNNQSGTLTVTNSTLYSNTAPASTGGGFTNGGTLLIQDTLIANNLGGDCAGGAPSADSHNLADDFSCAGATVTDTVHLNLLPLQNYGGRTATMALGPGSAAINAGDDATCAPTDQRGVARPQGAHCDVGAYEREPAQPGPGFIVTRSADTDGGVCVPSHCTLREALNAANAHSGASVITFSIPVTDAGCLGPACTITLTGRLPAVTGTVTLDGSGQPLTVSGAGAYPVLSVTVGAHVSLNDLTIADGNSGAGDGGGLSNSGVLTVTRSTFLNNTALDGGGVVNSATLTVINSTFYNNTAVNAGGGLANGGTLTVINGTLVSNTAANSGTGLYSFGGATVLRNTLLADNPLHSDCAHPSGAFTADKYNLAASACGNATLTDTAHLKLGPLANNGGNTLTIALLAGSAAIDAGNDADCPATDQRGIARWQGLHCDAGAYEFIFSKLYLPLVSK